MPDLLLLIQSALGVPTQLICLCCTISQPEVSSKNEHAFHAFWCMFQTLKRWGSWTSTRLGQIQNFSTWMPLQRFRKCWLTHKNYCGQTHKSQTTSVLKICQFSTLLLWSKWGWGTRRKKWLDLHFFSENSCMWFTLWFKWVGLSPGRAGPVHSCGVLLWPVSPCISPAWMYVLNSLNQVCLFSIIIVFLPYQYFTKCYVEYVYFLFHSAGT